jgi:hypothetical protein
MVECWTDPDEEERTMAKGEQRGNREAKKPKKEKPKAAPAASPFAKQDTGATPARKGTGKK